MRGCITLCFKSWTRTLFSFNDGILLFGMWLLTRSRNYFKILSRILLLLQLLLRRLYYKSRLLLQRKSSWVRVACGYSCCGKLYLRRLIDWKFCWGTCSCWASFEVITFYYLNSWRRSMPKLPTRRWLKKDKFAICFSYFIDCECINWRDRIFSSLHWKLMGDTSLFYNRSKRLICVSNCGDFSTSTIFIAIFINLL